MMSFIAIGASLVAFAVATTEKESVSRADTEGTVDYLMSTVSLSCWQTGEDNPEPTHVLYRDGAEGWKVGGQAKVDYYLDAIFNQGENPYVWFCVRVDIPSDVA